ncbi:hemagglutinin repeat-containing protein [Rhizobium ruizarguesonis]
MMRLLLAEDDPLIARDVTAQLTKAGFNVVHESDGEAIAKDGGSIASASLTAGFSYEKSSASSSTSTPVVTSVGAGRSVTIEATSGDLTGHGAQIAAGYGYGDVASDDDKAGDITLKAGHDITLESAQATSETGSDSKSANASFGVSAGIGLQGVGVGVTGGAGAGMSKSDATSITQVNSHVTGSGDITISSGNDTTLKGAVVSGNTITADVHGDLSIISAPDVGSSANSSASAGFSLSGTVGGGFLPVTTQLSGLQFGGGLGSGATNWISEQSGLLSTGKMDIEVGGNTDLQAGKIISKSGDLALSTDTLTYSDFLGQKGYGGFSAQIGIEIPGNELPGAPPANNTLEGTYQLDDTRQTVRATIGPGTVTIRNEEKQAALEQSGATAPLADLNRDPDNAYEITRDKHIDLEIYLSTRSVNALAEGIRNAFAPGGFIDRYLLGKRLTPEEVANVKAGVDALVNGGEFVGCGQKQGFNLLDIFFTPAYAEGFSTDCTIRQPNGEFIHLGIQTYQACQDAIYAYLSSLDTDERLNVIKAAAFASYTDNPTNGESWVKNGWLLDAIAKLDGGSSGPAYEAYLQATHDAAVVKEQLDQEQWAASNNILNDPSTTLSQKFQKLEDAGINVNAVIAMAILGGVANGGSMLGKNGAQFASKTIWKGNGKERIDVENPNPGQRPGQIHYQDNNGNKYLYDPHTNSFPTAPKSVNNLLKNSNFMAAIVKGLKNYLGENL